MRMVTSNMIKSLRKSRNLTQEQLGILSGMSKSQISKMENGTLGSEETVLRLLDALGYELELKVVDKYPSERSERERILGVLRSFKNSQGDKYGIERIALFGSCARGEQTVDSDVDILISIKRPSLFVLSEITVLLESVLKRKVDLVSEKSRSRQEFMDNIKKDLIYV